MTEGQRRAAQPSAAPARERLIAAAGRLIAAGGTSAATSRAIADEAGENLGAITYYFGSKDRLVSESLVTAARHMIEPVIANLADPTRDPVSKMMSSVQVLRDILEHNEAQLPAYVQGLAAATIDDSVRNEVRRLHTEIESALAADMETQLEQGLLPEWIEPEPMASLIVALVNGVVLASAISPEETDAPAIATQFTHLLLTARPGSS